MSYDIFDLEHRLDEYPNVKTDVDHRRNRRLILRKALNEARQEGYQEGYNVATRDFYETKDPTT